MKYAGIILLLSLMGIMTSCKNHPNSQTDQGKTPMNTTDPRPVVIIDTSMGTIKAELWADKAPLTVANFLSYVDKGFYNGLIFHRVIDGFMIQGGGFTANMQQKPTAKNIQNEASIELRHERGILGMARTNDINSANSQFFINLVDNAFLNHKSNNPKEFGYCAFGKVIEGMEVVDAIGKVKTRNWGTFSDVPAQPITINSIHRLNKP